MYLLVYFLRMLLMKIFCFSRNWIKIMEADLNTILLNPGLSHLAIKVGSLLVDEVKGETFSSNFTFPSPWIFLKNNFLRLLLKWRPDMVAEHSFFILLFTCVAERMGGAKMWCKCLEPGSWDTQTSYSKINNTTSRK